jgi:hypothetical protein
MNRGERGRQKNGRTDIHSRPPREKKLEGRRWADDDFDAVVARLDHPVGCIDVEAGLAIGIGKNARRTITPKATRASRTLSAWCQDKVRL